MGDDLHINKQTNILITNHSPEPVKAEQFNY
jgi:hypothetical protein